MYFGPHILGHAPDVIVHAVREAAPHGLHVGIHNPHQEGLARLLVEAAPGMEQVIFANSGTEAILYAIRAARAYTGETKIGLFDGCYHSVHDTVLCTTHRSSPREAPVAFPRSFLDVRERVFEMGSRHSLAAASTSRRLSPFSRQGGIVK